MRIVLSLLAAAASCAASVPAAAQTRGSDDNGGFDDRGYDRSDRTPDWNYRRGESEGKGAYYDGGRYGPRGLPANLSGPGAETLDPWLSRTDEGRGLVRKVFDKDGDGRIKTKAAVRANTWFRRYADTDRDLRLTDAEIRIALVTVEKHAN